MAWLAVDENGKEGVFKNRPIRGELNFWYDEQEIDEGIFYDTEISLPRGSIKKLIGRELTWNDEPVELKEV